MSQPSLGSIILSAAVEGFKFRIERAAIASEFGVKSAHVIVELRTRDKVYSFASIVPLHNYRGEVDELGIAITDMILKIEEARRAPEQSKTR